MKIATPIAQLYARLFRSDVNDTILSGFNSKEKILWESMISRELDDEEAYALLYNGKSRQAYNQFKAGFFQKLIMIISNYDSDKISNTQKEIIWIYRTYSAIQVMWSLGLQSSGVKIAEKLVQKAKLYNINIVGRDVCRLISIHYKIRDKDARKGKQYMELYEAFAERVDLEDRAEFMNADIIGSNIQVRNSDLAGQYVKQLEPYLEVDSHKLHLYYYYMKMVAQGEDKRGIIEAAAEGLDYFTNLYYDHVIAKNIFRNWKMEAHLQLLELGEVKDLMNTSISELPEGNQKDITMLNLVKVHLFNDEYKEAASILDDVKSSPRFRFNKSWFKYEYWTLKLYTHLISRLGFLPEDSTSLRKIKHNLSRNGEDRVEHFIAYTIIGILDNGADHVIEHDDDITHWIRKDVSHRTRIFLRQLQAIGTSKYDKQIDESQMEKLGDHPLNLSFEKSEEVVPWEDVWRMCRECRQSSKVNVGVRAMDGRW